MFLRDFDIFSTEPMVTGSPGRRLERASLVALALDAHLRRQQPSAALRLVGLVRDHALREQRRERLAHVALQFEMSGVAHRAREEARVEQVQDRVLDAADVLVDGQPVAGRGLVDGLGHARDR